MFWWYYKSPYKTQDPNNPWPIVMWLAGGPVSISFQTKKPYNRRLSVS